MGKSRILDFYHFLAKKTRKLLFYLGTIVYGINTVLVITFPFRGSDTLSDNTLFLVNNVVYLLDLLKY